jgi:serine/threonine-protein kinase
MLSGLEAAHALDIVHRDMKPENVFISRPRGSLPLVKLLDFGMCRRQSGQPMDERTLTRVGTVVGTPEYMAPEQAMGAATDARSDVYAVGLVLYELLAGMQPFIADNFGKLVLEITQKPVPPLPAQTPGGETIPRGLAAVVLKCLEKQPNARFPTAAALAGALSLYGGEHYAPAQSADPASGGVDEAALAAAIRPSRTPMIAAIIVVLLLAAAVGWTFVSPGSPPAPTPAPKVAAPAPPPVPAAPKTVWLDVSSTPIGAQVKRGSEVLGVTPLRVEVPRGDAASLSLALADYVEETREVALSADVELKVDLRPVEKPKEKPAPAPKKKKPGKHK